MRLIPSSTRFPLLVIACALALAAVPACGSSDSAVDHSGATDDASAGDGAAKTDGAAADARTGDATVDARSGDATDGRADGGADGSLDGLAPSNDAGLDAAPDGPDGGASNTGPKANKIDLLFMIDNSTSMFDKEQILATGVPDLLTRLVDPRCVDPAGHPVVMQPASPSTPCPAGSAREFPPIADIHIGIIDSSLGGHGSDACDPTDPGFPNNDDKGHLVARSSSGDGGTAPTYQNQGFLAWDPGAKLNPPGEADLPALTSRFTDMVVGVGQVGCGFESQLEAVYRFLVDPEPYATITATLPNPVVLTGIDNALLAERANFLRPDSLVAVVSISDENDCSLIDSGQAYLALQSGNVLPRATSICKTDPNSPCCMSCAQANHANCPDPSTDPECMKGAYTSADDPYALRCFNQKRHFGVDFLQPIARYVDGMTLPAVTKRDGTVVLNPLFTDLSCTNGDAGCKPPRDPRLVFWAALVGVPWQDIARDPTDVTKGYFTSDELVAHGRWQVILGDPAAYVPPSDPLMVESTAPRTGVNPVTGDPVAGVDAGFAANPINGHEWDTTKAADPASDLEYACVYPLNQPKDCTSDDPACDCGNLTLSAGSNNPLCENPADGGYGTRQYRAKAYPGLRHLAVLKGLGPQGIVASICPANVVDTTSPAYGYRPALEAIVERIGSRLATQ